MPSHSAGLLLHRRRAGRLEVLLVHPGGPLWAKRDLGAWSIPKGEYVPGSEDPLAAARREFAEELGLPAPGGEAVELGEVRQRSGKRVTAFAVAADLDVSRIVSNTCAVQWPPRSGRTIQVPEVDRAEWFALAEARERVNPAQVALLDRVESAIADSIASSPDGELGEDGTR